MKEKKRTTKKHLVIINNNGILSATTPKNWARANQERFPKFDFCNSDNTPTVDEIENYLVSILNFSKVENEEIVINYPFKNI